MSETEDDRPRITVGVCEFHDSIVLLDERGRQWAIEAAQIDECTTYAQVRALEPQLTVAWAPDLDGFDPEDYPDDAAYDARSSGSAADGDWPPMPTAFTLDVVRADDELAAVLASDFEGRIETTTFNGDFYALPVDRFDDVIQLLQRLGYQVERNSPLVNVLGMS